MRILVTNDDGVRAPGIAALTRAVVAAGHDVVVVAPLVDYSGAGAAVGPIHSRQGVDYETHVLHGIAEVPAFGINGPPALAAMLTCVGAFGPMPDLVLSGINHGANVGRSTMHSGTVGAALTAAHFGLRALAVSLRFGEDPVPWETPATVALALIDELAEAPPATVLNVNVPDVPLAQVAGVRLARLGTSGTIRSAVHDTGGPAEPHVTLPPAPSGTLRLDVAPPWTGSPQDPDTDAALLSQDHVTVTALSGVREAKGADAVAEQAVAAAAAALGAGPGRRLAAG